MHKGESDMKYLKLSDIYIRESFANSIPKEEKIEECRKFWNTYHQQDRWIVVNNRHTLVDGYIQYLVLKENNIEVAEVHFSNKKKKKWVKKEKTYRETETTYIYGIHTNSNDHKERVWRIPNSWWNGWANTLNIGDMIWVNTKHGVAPIEITKIARLSECPISIPVKTVVRKMRNKEVIL